MKKGFRLGFMWGERFLLEMEQFHDFGGYRPLLKNRVEKIRSTAKHATSNSSISTNNDQYRY